MESGKLFGFYSTLFKYLGLSPGTLFAPELRFVAMSPIIVNGPYNTVPMGGFSAVHAGDVLPHFPLRSKRLRSKMNWSAWKKMETPARFATTAAINCPIDAKRIPAPGKDGHACQWRW